ncbi:hypothetical protein WJX74_004882 [Apatococcus lobatus]|uniref:tRNA-splicing endonuclease subunit Sen54 N-terminal domain-containing protein n=1 Tax=Apatococcus lobatus TaxID=904363 RepID=A0AAW1QYR0_9CHLO
MVDAAKGPVSSIFRRGGNKQETSAAPEQLATERQELDRQLDELEAVWSIPKQGDVSIALWQQDSLTYLVVVPRGKLLQHMGFNWKGKLHLHPEEAMYLMDRANLVLFARSPEGRQPAQLSLLEAYRLMTGAGASMDQYQVYCHLMRNGFIVTRHPALWSLPSDAEPKMAWRKGQAAMPSQPELGETNVDFPPDTAALDVTWLKASNGIEAAKPSCDNEQPPLKRRRKGHQAGQPDAQSERQANSMQWWPQLSEEDATQAWPPAAVTNAPRCEVEVACENLAASLLRPRLAPLAPMQLLEQPSSDPEDAPCIVYDIFKPNSKFSRKRPDPVAFRVALATKQVPALWQTHKLQACSPDVPVRLACVNGGDVSFVELMHSNLPILVP